MLNIVKYASVTNLLFELSVIFAVVVVSELTTLPSPTSDFDNATQLGAAETVPYFMVTNLARTIGELKERQIWIIGASDEATSSLYQSDLKGSVALVLGAEGAGLRQLTRKSCDALVNIPMLGAVESLNVSVASGICLYEAVRQRGF